MLFCRQIRIAPGVTQTNTQTDTKLKLCGPWLAPDVTERLLHSYGNKRGLCQWEIDLEFLRVDSKYTINEEAEGL